MELSASDDHQFYSGWVDLLDECKNENDTIITSVFNSTDVEWSFDGRQESQQGLLRSLINCFWKMISLLP